MHQGCVATSHTTSLPQRTDKQTRQTGAMPAPIPALDVAVSAEVVHRTCEMLNCSELPVCLVLMQPLTACLS